jgi:hypothetical protein
VAFSPDAQKVLAEGRGCGSLGSPHLIRDGEVDMMSIWNARASELKQQGVPVEVVWNGAVSQHEHLVGAQGST